MPKLLHHKLFRFSAIILFFIVLAVLSGKSIFAQTSGGLAISNQASAVYTDENGNKYQAISQPVSVSIASVRSLAVTPDETAPSASVAQNSQITRTFTIKNNGNVSDSYLITAADVNSPAELTALYFDLDRSGTVTSADQLITLNSTTTPTVAPGGSIDVLAVVKTNDLDTRSQLVITLTAQSKEDSSKKDSGKIINALNRKAKIVSPDDSGSGPRKLVNDQTWLIVSTGQVVTYSIAFRNSGDVPAENVLISDDLADGIEYVPGSVTLNKRSLTDNSDSDEAVASSRKVAVRIPSIPAGEAVKVTFQARISAGRQSQEVINVATITGDNVDAVQTNAANIVVNAYGVVYAARSEGRVKVAGAKVSLLNQDGTIFALPAGGNLPNINNNNPYITGADGRFNYTFGPVPGIDTASTESRQSGPSAKASREEVLNFWLKIEAPGYLPRLLSLEVQPSTRFPGFWEADVHGADGLPVAEPDSFQLTEGDVDVEDVMELGFNIPMYEAASLSIEKSADRSAAEIGDVVSYRVAVQNHIHSDADNLIIRDQLPAAFLYADGSAQVQDKNGKWQPITPQLMPGNLLVFDLDGLDAGERKIISYRVRVGANTKAGVHINSAIAEGDFPSGEKIVTPAAKATVRISDGAFSMRQVIIGRVYVDANGNGSFDKGDTAVPDARVYTDKGQFVVTDSAGMYNIPVVEDGSLVLKLDESSLPSDLVLVTDTRREDHNADRLLRTPLLGGSLLSQNFALKISDEADDLSQKTAKSSTSTSSFADHDDDEGEETAEQTKNQTRSGKKKTKQTSDKRRKAPQLTKNLGNREPRKAAEKVVSPATTVKAAVEQPQLNKNVAQPQPVVVKPQPETASTTQPVNAANPQPANAEITTTTAAGSYETTSTEAIAPVAPGSVEIVTPKESEVIMASALELEARVATGWTIQLSVNDSPVGADNIALHKEFHTSQVESFTFVGINLKPGVNRIVAKAISPDGREGLSKEVSVMGRGVAKRLEIITERKELRANSRDAARVVVRAFDEWGNPALDSQIAINVSQGNLRVANKTAQDKTEVVNGTNPLKIASETNNGARQQVINLKDGVGVAQVIAGNTPGSAEITATVGRADAKSTIQYVPDLRSSLLVGLAEFSFGKSAPQMSLRGVDSNFHSRLGFFFKGRVLGKNLLTLSYDSERSLNRTSGRDRMFEIDPLDRAYPVFGDSSTRFEEAQSNSKLYARIDRGRSFAMFGDFETEMSALALSGYSRKLTGVKLHLENSNGDFVSATGARPDTSFARDVFPGDQLGLIALTHSDILQGSETVTLETRDRRNPELIISREQLIRSVDYNLDPLSGQIFFMRPLAAFDLNLNLVQAVVTYEHFASGNASNVYTGRASKRFKGLGLRLGLSFINQRQESFGSFYVGGFDGEKSTFRGGKLRFEYAMSRGSVAAGGNGFGSTNDLDGNNTHNGSAVRVELEQPLPYRQAILRADYTRSGADFLNPFGSTIAPGAQRSNVSVELKPRNSSTLKFGFMDERNQTENVDNQRSTASVEWNEQLRDNLRLRFGYDYRRFTDARGNITEGGDNLINSSLITLGAEWKPTSKLSLAVKREQNLGEADPTYPNQTTIAAKYQVNNLTNIFLTQRLASDAIRPISDLSSTGFASTTAKRETAVGVETKLIRFSALSGRYQIENGANGTDTFAVIGLQNKLPISKKSSIEIGYERGFHLVGEGKSFNSVLLGYSWQNQSFRSSVRYELRDRLGLGSIFTAGAAGKLNDTMTVLGRFQFARGNANDLSNKNFQGIAAFALRPLKTDRFAMLFSYNTRSTSQNNIKTLERTTDRVDTISTDGLYQVSKNLELYGRFALKFGENSRADLPGVSTLTYLAQGRAQYKLGKNWDVAAESRFLTQPSSLTSRFSNGAELGYWLTPDVRLGAGYNWTKTSQPPTFVPSETQKSGFYFTVTTKLSRLFDLFGGK